MTKKEGSSQPLKTVGTRRKKANRMDHAPPAMEGDCGLCPQTESTLRKTNAFEMMMSTRTRSSLSAGLMPSTDGLMKRRLDDDGGIPAVSVDSWADSVGEQQSSKRFKETNGCNSLRTIIKWKSILTSDGNEESIDMVDGKSSIGCNGIQFINREKIEVSDSNGLAFADSLRSILQFDVCNKQKEPTYALRSTKKIPLNRDDEHGNGDDDDDDDDDVVIVDLENISSRDNVNVKRQTSAIRKYSKRNKAKLNCSETYDDNGSKRSSKVKKRKSHKKESACKYNEKKVAQQLNHKKGEKSPTRDNLEKDDLEPTSILIIADDDLSNVKSLAPVFKHCNGESESNRKVQQQRQDFLYSNGDLEISLKCSVMRSTDGNFDSSGEDLNIIFPSISHIQQFDGDEDKHRKSIPSLTILNKFSNSWWTDLNDTQCDNDGEGYDHEPYVILSDARVRELCKKGDHSMEKVYLRPNYLQTIEDKREIILGWKKVFERFPTFKCFNQMYARHLDMIESETELYKRSLKECVNDVRARDTDITYKHTPPYNGELLLLEKYKANLFEEIIINVGPVAELREFLLKWTTDHKENTKSSKKINRRTSHNTDNPYTNTVALVGPISSGKTNAVYVLANSMHFNVLEINASMIRNGKRLVQELHESTQSHQVRKSKTGNHSSEFIESLWAKNKPKDTQSLQSLLLIEDADILLDKYDIGFLDAIHTLSLNSKRPIIIVVNDKNCACLQKFTTLQKINFHTSQPLNIAKYMCILSLVENCPISLYDCLHLYLYNNLDIRKTMHQLQFFMQSGGDYFPVDSAKNVVANPTTKSSTNRAADSFTDLYEGTNINTHSTLLKYFVHNVHTSNILTLPVYLRLVTKHINFMMQQYIALPSSNSADQREEKCLETFNIEYQPINLIDNIHRLHRNLITASNIIDRNTIALNVTKNKCVYSNCIDITDYTTTNHLSSIADYLTTKSIEVLLRANPEEAIGAYNPEIGRQKRDFIHEKLYLMPGYCNRRSIHLDYEPILRTVCRSENNRLQSERRCTRFHHYLQSYTKSMYTSCQNIYEETCLVLQ